ncbi:MAG: sigma-70 family RNA polymerase sigma factor [Acidobacteria bacterium]|nr:sigma-70 family RNA polymerase sigma factor [Acidobacteriota bacterium]
MIYEAAIEDLPVGVDDEAARLRRGDPAALAAAVSRFQHRLYRYFLRLVRQPALADDLFQQTWLHVVRQIHRYDPARSFDTWLFAIAHNAAIDFLRRRPGESIEDCPIAAPQRDALSAAIDRERSTMLAEAVGALPAIYREALTLRFEEGMKLDEIAEVTRAPLATVKSRIQRGLEALRGSLRKEDLS